jgi:hypothetical protein
MVDKDYSKIDWYKVLVYSIMLELSGYLWIKLEIGHKI